MRPSGNSCAGQRAHTVRYVALIIAHFSLLCKRERGCGLPAKPQCSKYHAICRTLQNAQAYMMTIKFLSDRCKRQTKAGLGQFSFLGQAHTYAGVRNTGPAGAAYSVPVGKIPVNRYARRMNTNKGMAQAWKMWYTKV